MYDPGTLYLDPILTNFSVGYQDQTLYGLRILPETPVNTQSGKYRVFDRSSWLIYDDRREPGTVANEIEGRKWSEDTFSTQEHSLQASVKDEEYQELRSQGGFANSDAGVNLDIEPARDATEAVTGAILLKHEKLVADTVRNTANYPVANTTTLAGSQQWNDYTNGVTSTSNPVNDIIVGIRAIQAATGRDPNTLVLPKYGISYIENHPRVVDRFKNFTLNDPEAFRRLTGFTGTILEVDSKYNAANNIDAAESIQSLWGKDVWLGIVDPTPGQRTKTFGKTFAQRYPSGDLRPTDRWREEPRKSDLVRVSYKYDVKIVSSGAGYLIKTAWASTAF